MTKELLAQISSHLSKHFGRDETILHSSPVFGGCINNCFKLSSQNNCYFIKVNQQSKYPGMFEAEKIGLELLSKKSEFHCPEVYFTSTVGDDAFILMEFIESSSKKAIFWKDFGIKLARLHRESSQHFGLEHDNYIGSLKQINTARSNWANFFVEKRLMVQEELARNAGLIDSSISRKFHKLYNKIAEHFPIEKPSLLHGDLWSGNYMVNAEGEAVIMDPAIYYGHREMDLGMSQLFGGFGSEMYASYNEEYELEKGWEQRIELCQLYPLMVHVNLFGGSYLQQVNSILKEFV